MKVDYDYNANTITHICSACGYKHTNMRVYNQTIEGDDEFIEVEGFELHSTDRSDGYYPLHRTHTIYACPKCGVLQIEI